MPVQTKGDASALCPHLQSLRALRNHENIVQLMEVFREKNQLFLVFEFMQSNLYDIIKTR